MIYPVITSYQRLLARNILQQKHLPQFHRAEDQERLPSGPSGHGATSLDLASFKWQKWVLGVPTVRSCVSARDRSAARGSASRHQSPARVLRCQRHPLLAHSHILQGRPLDGGSGHCLLLLALVPRLQSGALLGPLNRSGAIPCTAHVQRKSILSGSGGMGGYKNQQLVE